MTNEAKVKKLNMAWNKIRNGIGTIKEVFINDKGLDLWILRLEAVNDNLHKYILNKLKKEIFKKGKK